MFVWRVLPRQKKKQGLEATKIVGITTLGIAKGIVEACAKFCTVAVLGVSVLLVNYVVPARRSSA